MNNAKNKKQKTKNKKQKTKNKNNNNNNNNNNKAIIRAGRAMLAAKNKTIGQF
jgi:hypothetical protein